ncbi:MAG: HzsA-related protein, partial [Planctomycetota bacterium]
MRRPSLPLLALICTWMLATGAPVRARQTVGGSWIWHPGSSATSTVNRPAGKWYFRRHVAIPDDRPIKTATCRITADNAFVLFVNGTKVGSGNNWQNVYSLDVKKLLTAGDNVLAVRADNWDGPGANPAGLIGCLRVRFAKGKPLVLHTDGRWRTSSTRTGRWEAADFDDSGWRKATVIDWNGWKAITAELASSARGSPIAKSNPLVEPETRTLSAEEGESIIVNEWLFQAEGKPLDGRALQEIAWAREMAARLAERDPPPDLGPELAALGRLERNPDGLAAEELYLEVRRVKRKIMFKDPLVDFSRLVFIDVPERYPHESMHRVYPQAQLNSVRLLLLEGLNPAGEIRKVTDQAGPGWYWRPDLSFDGKRVLFCFRPKKDRTFHLYEVNVDGSGLRQLTDGRYDDQDPIYMPDGHIVFVSNRGCSHARCVVGHPSTVVARCDADGGNIYLISAGNEPEYTPAVMPNGRIIYTRWEYTDKELMRIQSLWTVNPDGTGTSAYWGNQSYWPDMLLEARPIPGSRRVMFAGHGHHQVYWGSIGIVDPAKGFNYPDGLTKVTWDVPWCEVGNGPAERPETPAYHASGRYRGYKSPYPLSEELFLVSARAAGRSSKFKVFLMDVYGNREVIYEGAFHVLYPIPVRPRARPPVVPDRVEWAGAQKGGRKIEPGVFYCADIYQGAPEILRGKARYLRVIQLDFNTMTLGKKIQDVDHTRARTHMHVGPVVSVVVNDGVKWILGYVPIEKDDSVSFQAPPCVPLHFQLLDEKHRALH